MALPASRLKTVGYGKLRPVADNRTREGRAKNRGVELQTNGSLQNSGPRSQNQ
jgi:OOP family OmpA-OmpF porin